MPDEVTPTTGNVRNPILASCVIFGTIGAFLPMYWHLGKIDKWGADGSCWFLSPSDAQALALSIILGVASIGCALGLNIGAFVRQLIAMFTTKE